MLFRRTKTDHDILEKSIFPIDETENIIVRLARSFPTVKIHRPEVFGYLIGLQSDKLTHVVIPKYVMGIKKDKNYEMTNIGSIDIRSKVMLASNEQTGEFGILIMASPHKVEQRFLKGNFTFIPANLLILNRPIIEFVSFSGRTRLFPKMSVNEIKESQIVNAIDTSLEKKRIHIQTEGAGWTSIDFLPEPLLNVDAFISSRRIYPLNQFFLQTLRMNKFTGQPDKPDLTHYGRVHIHFAYDSWQLVTDPLLRALYRMDRKFFELMSPIDAVSMVDSGQAARQFSEHLLQAEQILEGIIAMDPKNLAISGISYFDKRTLNDDQDIRRFETKAADAYKSRSIEANRSWFQYIKTKCTPDRPQYAAR